MNIEILEMLSERGVLLTVDDGCGTHISWYNNELNNSAKYMNAKQFIIDKRHTHQLHFPLDILSNNIVIKRIRLVQ